MTEKINYLKSEFEKIKSIGWVKETRKCKGSCGYTFKVSDLELLYDVID